MRPKAFAMTLQQASGSVITRDGAKQFLGVWLASADHQTEPLRQTTSTEPKCYGSSHLARLRRKCLSGY